jgi:hypothetical protein
MPTLLQVSTPEGESGRVMRSEDDYIFRYRDDAAAHSAISLLMPPRMDEYRHRGLHPIFQVCGVEQPQDVIRTQLQALEQILASSSEVTEKARHVVAAIQKSADPFRQTFG